MLSFIRRSILQRALSSTTPRRFNIDLNAEALGVFTSPPPPPPPPPESSAPPADSPAGQAIAAAALAQKPTKPPAFYDIPPEHDPLLHLLTTSIMKNGRYSKASKITSDTLLYIHTYTRAPALPILRAAILMASPAVRNVRYRQGTKSLVRPYPLNERQRTKKGIDWLLKEVEGKMSGRTLQERLAKEVIAIVRGDSPVLKLKEETHRLAMVNRFVLVFCSFGAALS
jgi:small subunit ribosomal protein S7